MKLDDNITLKELNKFTEVVKENGDLFFLKIDGERDENHITIIISSPPYKNKEQIRFDGQELKPLLIKAIDAYFNQYV